MSTLDRITLVILALIGLGAAFLFTVALLFSAHNNAPSHVELVFLGADVAAFVVMAAVADLWKVRS